MNMAQSPIPFHQVLDALLDSTRPFPPKYLNQLSDLDENHLAELGKVWPRINTDRRAALLEDMEELCEVDTLVYFDNLARMVLDDEDARVRAGAIRVLWETEDTHLAPIFIKMLETDPDQIVRANAAAALGQFIYLGELEELPPELLTQVENSLFRVMRSKEPPLVRRRALEALGYSGRPEVAGLIRKAYQAKEVEWQASALFAMGRSADSNWSKAVIDKLHHPDLDVQLEAVRAAGQLELPNARNDLIDLVSEQELDSEVWAAAVWSLSQIGGENVRETLEALLEESEDDQEIEILENCLENLEFTDGFPTFTLLDIDPQSEDDMDHYIDIDEELDDKQDQL